MNKTLTGIHIVEKKYSLIWLRDNEKQLSQTMKYFDFVAILHQSFNEQQIKKILEALNCEERLLIDFDKEKVISTYEVVPKQLIEVKGLMGDSSDNIPGVPGIG